VNGNEARAETTLEERNEMERLLVRHTGLSQKQAQRRLMDGVDSVHVATSPEAGFFHMLDFSGLKGRYFDDDLIRSMDGFKIDSERHISTLMRHFNVRFAAGAWAGLDQAQMFKRVTFALPPEDIIEFVERLRAMVAITMDEEALVANDYNLKPAP